MNRTEIKTLLLLAALGLGVLGCTATPINLPGADGAGIMLDAAMGSDGGSKTDSSAPDQNTWPTPDSSAMSDHGSADGLPSPDSSALGDHGSTDGLSDGLTEGGVTEGGTTEIGVGELGVSDTGPVKKD